VPITGQRRLVEEARIGMDGPGHLALDPATVGISRWPSIRAAQQSEDLGCRGTRGRQVRLTPTAHVTVPRGRKRHKAAGRCSPSGCDHDVNCDPQPW
jgi:hypothetical protein